MRPIALFPVLFLTVLLFSFSNISAAQEVQVNVAPEIGHSEENGLSSPLYLQHSQEAPARPRVIPKHSIVDAFPGIADLPKVQKIDTVLQKSAVSPTASLITPKVLSQILNFDGVNNLDNVLPPDTNCAVGPNHIVQMVNTHFEIWDKAGNWLYGPAATKTLWSGLGGPCATQDDGDGLAIYDRIADRWVMTQFALPNYPNGPFYQCIAVSKTSDPTGQWYQYSFLLSNTKMNDYPKLAVWPDAYYMSANQFLSNGSYAGVGAFAFDRNSMISGLSATFIYFDESTNPAMANLFSMLPSTLDGATLPPSTTPNYFVQFDDNALGYPQDQLEIWKFHVDWTNTANSTFTGPTLLATASFSSDMCNYGATTCIPQPGTSQGLDAIPDRLMYRLQYRNFGSYQTMVVNHTVDTNGANHAGIRWYELRNSGSGWSIYQQGTYSPDSSNKWMGSIAMDGAGNIALGYSVSSSTVYPSIRYTGRIAGDPLGTMTQGEKTLMAGGGSQTDNSGRWGDYSSMVVDPSDDRTFWYTNEYYSSTSKYGWQTWIGSFKIEDVPPTLVSLTPSEMISAAGKAQKLTAVYGDPSGYKTLKAVDILVSPTGSGANAIWARYNRNSNTLYLFNNAGTVLLSPGCTPGSAVILQNGQGNLNCQQTTAAGSGNNLTVNWNITPKAAFVPASPMQVLMTAKDTANVITGPTTMGSWTIMAADTTAPTIGSSFIPALPLTSSSMTPQTFTAVYSDADGYANLRSVQLRVSPTGSGANSIWVTYNRNNNLLYIYNGAGTAIKSGSCTPGSVGTLQNSYGILDCQNTTVTAAVPDLNSLTVNWSITPKTAFASAAAKQVRIMAKDNDGLTSGWVTEGNWTISP